MLSTILTLLLAAPEPGAVIWRFPDPDSEALRAAAAQARGDDPTHRVTDAEIEETLAQSAPLGGCLDDARTCTDPALDALSMFGVRARVDATASREGDLQVVHLRVAPTTGAEPRTVTARGATLEAALSAGLAQIRGESAIQVTVKPEEAAVLVDGEAVGQGSGHYSVAPGHHTIRVEAPGYAPLSQTADVKVGTTPALTFEMASADGQLVLKIVPATATVRIDDKPVADWTQPILLAPKTYQIAIAAEGYVPHTQKLEVKQATRHDLTVTLPEKQPTWQEALQSPHPDTVKFDGYVRADLRFTSVFDGPVGVSSGRDLERVTIDTQDDSVGLLGVNVAAGWRQRYWFIEALGMSIDAGGDTDSIDLAEPIVGTIEGLSRITLKPGWVGARYPAWRLDPYIAGGIVLVFESFDLVLPDDTRSISNRLFELGIEFGVRYAFTEEWSARVSGGFEFWPDERTSGAIMLGAEWAVDVPEWL